MKAMKYSFLIIILFAFGCKKDKTDPTPAPQPNNTPPAYKKIKSTRYLDIYTAAPETRITNSFYHYNLSGELVSINSTDSSSYNGGWYVGSNISNYYYSNGRMYLRIYVQNTTTNTVNYFYNNENKLELEVSDYNGSKDSIKYTYSGNNILGKRGSGVLYTNYYYSNNLDSICGFNSGTRTNKSAYFYNNKLDLSNCYLNNYIPIVTNKNEIVNILTFGVNPGPSYSYTYTYDSENYPTKVVNSFGQEMNYIYE